MRDIRIRLERLRRKVASAHTAMERLVEMRMHGEFLPRNAVQVFDNALHDLRDAQLCIVGDEGDELDASY